MPTNTHQLRHPSILLESGSIILSQSSIPGLSDTEAMTLMSDAHTCHKQLAFLSLYQMSPNLSLQESSGPSGGIVFLETLFPCGSFRLYLPLGT